jgi:hypothetical protein
VFARTSRQLESACFGRRARRLTKQSRPICMLLGLRLTLSVSVSVSVSVCVSLCPWFRMLHNQPVKLYCRKRVILPLGRVAAP